MKSETAPLIYSLIPKIMAEVGAVGKDRKNEQQGYKFRGIEDIYNAVHPVFARNGVFCCPEVLDINETDRVTKAGGVSIRVRLTIRHRFYAPDGSYVDVILAGEGIDSSDKATNKAMSAAMKYAFVELLSLPFAEVDDSDKDSPEGGYRKTNGRDVAVSREPIDIGKPKGGPSGASVPADVKTAVGAAPQAAGTPVKPPVVPIPEPEQPVAYIGPGEVANFAKAFREALPEFARKDEETLRHDWLRQNGYLDILGQPSTKVIRKGTFIQVRAAAVAWAKALLPTALPPVPPPFTGATNDDIPW